MFHSSCNVSSMCFPCASFKCDRDEGKKQCLEYYSFLWHFRFTFSLFFLSLQIVLCIVLGSDHYVRMNTIPNRRRAFETFSPSLSLWIRIACANVIVFANKFCIVCLSVWWWRARFVCLALVRDTPQMHHISLRSFDTYTTAAASMGVTLVLAAEILSTFKCCRRVRDCVWRKTCSINGD